LRERQLEAISRACRVIEEADEPPKLDELSKAAQMSSHYFHRTFKAIIGVTPRAYYYANRKKTVQAELTRGEHSISEVIYESGFNSSSRFYAASNGMLGMKPKEYREGGKDVQIYFAVGETSLGSILVASSEKGVCAISLGGDADELVRELQDRFPRATLLGGDEAFEAIVAQVVGLVENPSMGLDLPLDIRGTAFQQRVWEALRLVPAGKTASYSEIAKSLDAPKAVRAVASACASNVLAVAIPCHRVIKEDGKISGYRWGVDRKRELLRREKDV
jgi:AraC family transcriptional regulator of adaptative response/methylated-DNA-[protein]-cysteine methyltransferase